LKQEMVSKRSTQSFSCEEVPFPARKFLIQE
jgi:hypothetical protein